MKVIAINDAPIPENGYYDKGIYLDRAYYRGDIFELSEKTNELKSWNISNNSIIIHHDKIGVEMLVDKNNFIRLDNYRNLQIDKIL